MEDSEIIALFNERSEQAIKELEAKYGAAMRRTAANILNDRLDVEECLNDAYLGVWDSIPPHAPAVLMAYVCRLVRNAAINRYHANTARKRNSRYDAALSELEEYLPALESVESEYDARELSRALNRFLGTLPEKDRIIFVRRYWYADAVSDIAAALHMSSNAVSVRLFRTREKLQLFLMKEGMAV